MYVCRRKMSIYFVKATKMSFLYTTKVLLVALLLLLSLPSCKSEYQERLEQARELKERILRVEANIKWNNQLELSNEIELLQEEINFLAKVSGNEEFFLKEVYKD